MKQYGLTRPVYGPPASTTRYHEYQMERSDEALIKLNTRLLEKYGDELFPDPSLYMSSPEQEIKGVDVKAFTFRLPTVYTWQYAQDAQRPTMEQLEAEITNLLVDDHYVAFKAMFAKYKTVYPFVPITSAGVEIDPNNMEPIVVFKTRFGHS